MIFDEHALQRIAARPVDMQNARAVISGLAEGGPAAGLDRPHRLAQYVAQIGHESAGFRYDREIWGPTPAQRRYEDRADLGHSPAIDGEAERFKGRGPIQITGRANYREFTAWARLRVAGAPDFERDPDMVNTDPWEGLVGIWYWEMRGLNRYADRGDIEMVTRRINGGLNGYQDRIAWLVRASLVMLGRAPDDVRGFQGSSGLIADGIAGPRTRAALHEALVGLPSVSFPRRLAASPRPPARPAWLARFLGGAT